MKKILCVAILVFMVSIMCSGCLAKSQGSEQKKQEVQQQSSEKSTKIEYLKESLADNKEGYNIISKGKYYIFSCKTSDVYVMFLDELDENVYEIVDIQIEHFTDGNFWLTYKEKDMKK